MTVITQVQLKYSSSVLKKWKYTVQQDPEEIRE